MIESKQIQTIWLDNPQPNFLHKTAIAIGSFDGIHLGHKAIIEKLIKIAGEKQLLPILLTFDPHPRIAFGQDFYILTTVYEREILLRKYNLPSIVHIKFTEKVSELCYDDFVTQYLIGSLGAKLIIVGYDHHFGNKRGGNPENLTKLGDKMGFETVIVSPVKVDDFEVKSSMIREFIKRGDIKNASKFLGHPYMVTGKAVPGRGLGSHIGYPTANIHFPQYKILPPDGVYAAKACVQSSQTYQDAMAYIGKAPTFVNHERMFEVHIFNHDGSPLYGKNFIVRLLEHIRQDITFHSIEELKAQIDLDAQAVKELLRIKQYKFTN